MGDWRTENLENHSGKDVMIIKRDEGVKIILFIPTLFSQFLTLEHEKTTASTCIVLD